MLQRDRFFWYYLFIALSFCAFYRPIQMSNWQVLEIIIDSAPWIQQRCYGSLSHRLAPMPEFIERKNLTVQNLGTKRFYKNLRQIMEGSKSGGFYRRFFEKHGCYREALRYMWSSGWHFDLSNLNKIQHATPLRMHKVTPKNGECQFFSLEALRFDCCILH